MSKISRLLNSAVMHITLLATCCMTGMYAYCQRPTVGLVLSGGGAKGIAHIGAIRALEENNIPIDYVTGTSMGAIIGSLYCCGYTPDEMEALIKSESFAHWSSGRMSGHDTYFCALPQPTPAIVSLNINVDGPSTGILPSSLISPLPMNFAFMDLFAAHTAQCNADFDNLFVPFRSVCSDIYHKHKVVCSKGSLGDAVRASMSFPVVFTPIELDSILVYDGGIYDNFPVDVMRQDFNPDFIIGVDVSGPNKVPNPASILQQVEDMIMQKSDYQVPPECGVRIHVPVQQFALLDWANCDTINAIGYNTTLALVDSIKSRVSSRVDLSHVERRRREFNAVAPQVRFSDVNVTGLSDSQNNVIKTIFNEQGDSTGFGIDRCRDAYYRVISSGKLRNLVPQAVWDKDRQQFSLHLKGTQMNRLKLGFGGYVSSAANSMVYFSAGLNTLSRVSSNVSLDAWLGQSFAALSLSGRISFPTSMPTYLAAHGIIMSHKMFDCVPTFYDNEVSLMQKTQYYGRLSWGAGVRRDAKLEISVGAARLTNRNYAEIKPIGTDRDKLQNTLGQLRALYESSTFESNVAPTNGHHSYISACGVIGPSRYLPQGNTQNAVSLGSHAWFETKARYQCYWTLSKHFSIGACATAHITNIPVFGTYGATMSMLPTFQPTPASFCQFNTRMTARQYIAAGITPVLYWGNFQVRPEAYLFVPGQELDIDKSTATPQLQYTEGIAKHIASLTQVTMGYSFNFAQLNVYGGYTTGHGRNWNVGLSFGLYFLPPSFL